MIPRLSSIALIFLMSMSKSYAGQFVGTLAFTPQKCELSRDCRLVYDFGYIDSEGVGWQSDAGDITDGATIPTWAQGIIGSPFESDFIKAAVIHDHYCKRNVRTWRQTHRVLYDALLTGGVDKVKASIMYYAVLIGGPKWVNLIPGSLCNVGQICVKSTSGTISIPDTTVVERSGVGKIAFRNSQYDKPWFQSELQRGKSFIESSGPAVTLNQVEELAKRDRPDDFFLHTEDAVRFEDSNSKMPRK